jgi:hypothetical protein
MTGFLPLFKRNKLKRVPIYRFDQGMGATDALGRVISFPLQVGSFQIWVDDLLGDDSNNGLSPFPGYRLNGAQNNGSATNTYQAGATGRGLQDIPGKFGPLKTIDAGLAKLPNTARVNQIGYQIRFAKGGIYRTSAITGGAAYHSGRPDYPWVFESYDREDPLNLAKLGRIFGGTPSDYPEIQVNGTAGALALIDNRSGAGNNNGGVAVRGCLFTSYDPSGYMGFYKNTTLNFIAYQPNVLFEGNIFDNVAVNLDNYTSVPYFNALISENNIIRLNVFKNQWSPNGASGVHGSSTNLTLEHNTFFHCGWRPGANRSDSPSTGGIRGGFDHAAYEAGQRGSVCDEKFNLYIDAATYGFSGRGSSTNQYSVHIDNGAGSVSGGSVADASVENPAGIYGRQNCVFAMGASRPPSSQNQVCQIANSLPGSTIEYPLTLNSPFYLGTFPSANIVVQREPVNGIQSYVNVKGLRAYRFGSMPVNTYGSVNCSVEDCLVYNLSPTNDQVYQEAGYFDKQSMVDDVTAYPKLGSAWKIYSAACRLLQLQAWRGYFHSTPKFIKLHYTTGAEGVGNPLTVVDPTIEGGAVITGYQWWRLRPAANNLSYTSASIIGETGKIYTPTAADVGFRIGCAIEITREDRKNIAVSLPTAVMS